MVAVHDTLAAAGMVRAPEAVEAPALVEVVGLVVEVR